MKTRTFAKPEIATNHIRWMIRRDMAEVLEIENHSFPFPWSDDDFMRCLRQRNCIGMVVEQDEKIVGFMIFELLKSSLRLLNLAVHKSYRRQGVGKAMVEKLKAKLSQQRRTQIELLIHERNMDGQFFFRQMGFEAIEIVATPWPLECDDDGYVMVRRIECDIYDQSG